MTIPAYLQPEAEATTLLAVKLQPRASANGIAGVAGSELKIRVTAPPVDSAANHALLQFVADRLECSTRQLEIVRGGKSRHKLIRLHGLTAREAADKL